MVALSGESQPKTVLRPSVVTEGGSYRMREATTASRGLAKRESPYFVSAAVAFSLTLDD